MKLIEISDIVDMLTVRIDALATELLPRGRREGGEWVEARRGAGGLGDSLKVRLSGARAGMWSHFSTGAKGDALELVSYVLFNNDKAKAVAWAKSWLGLDTSDPRRIKQQRAKARAFSQQREREEQEEREKKAGWAKRIWHNSSPVLSGTAVDLYLRGRGIDLKELPKMPGAIRFASSLRYPSGDSYPAMVTGIQNGDGRLVAVHRTFLEMRGGVCKKARVNNAKLTLGNWAGGFIPLNRGESGKPLKDAPKGDHVVLCEGIEDGLTIALCCPELRVLACVNVGNFQNIRLPQAIKTVTIAADNDDPASPAARSVQAAVDRFIGEGREVLIARSPVGKDFNDCLTYDPVTGEVLEGGA